MSATVIGHHGGRSSTGKARQMLSRLQAAAPVGEGPRVDLALAHGSHELTMTARRLGIPSSTTFDYEWAWLQHQLGCRAATRVVVPDSIPPERLATYGARASEAAAVSRVKSTSRFQARPGRLVRLVAPSRGVLVVLRPATRRFAYHRHSNPLFPMTLEHLGRLDDVHAFVIHAPTNSATT